MQLIKTERYTQTFVQRSEDVTIIIKLNSDQKIEALWTVFVKTIENAKFAIRVQSCDTLKTIQAILKRKTGEKFSLVIHGEVMKKSQTLKDFNLQPNETIYAV